MCKWGVRIQKYKVVSLNLDENELWIRESRNTHGYKEKQQDGVVVLLAVLVLFLQHASWIPTSSHSIPHSVSFFVVVFCLQ